MAIEVTTSTGGALASRQQIRPPIPGDVDGQTVRIPDVPATGTPHTPMQQPAAGLLADHTVLPSFDARLATIDAVLRPECFARMLTEIERLVTTERSYLPTHKKGGTVAYETLITNAPEVIAFYRSEEMQRLISSIVGAPVQPTPLHDQNSCSVLFYERRGDHIGWHYDHNFYKGRHFTVLIPMVNRNAEGSGLSKAQLKARVGGDEHVIETPPNRMIIFEGARVIHKVSPIAEGERRVLLSTSYCCDPRNSRLQGVGRRIKDTAFFGIRALWT